MALYKHFDTGVVFTTAELLNLYNDFNTEREGTFDDFLFDLMEQGTAKTGGIIMVDDRGVEKIMLEGLYERAVSRMDAGIRELIHDLYDGDDEGIFLEIYSDMVLDRIYA